VFWRHHSIPNDVYWPAAVLLLETGGRQWARLCQTAQVCNPSRQKHEILISDLAEIGFRSPSGPEIRASERLIGCYRSARAANPGLAPSCCASSRQ
jgi:hypothetical protein